MRFITRPPHTAHAAWWHSGREQQTRAPERARAVAIPFPDQGCCAFTGQAVQVHGSTGFPEFYRCEEETNPGQFVDDATAAAAAAQCNIFAHCVDGASPARS